MKKISMALLLLICSYLLWSQTTLLQENFTTYAGTAGTVPAGWNFSYNGDYTSASSCGASGINSYKFGIINASIITPAFANADSVRFWYKGMATDTASYLTIFETPDSATWTQVVKIKPIPTTGTTTHYHLNTLSTHLKFVYTKSAGNVAFDDFNVIKNGGSTTSSNTRFYRASYRDDPSTTIVIGWCDNGTSTNAKVYYDVVDYGTTYTSYAFNHAVDRTQSAYSLNHRFVRLVGLTPNTIYYFVVHDDTGTSARMYFKTLTDNPDVGITFIAGGDSRTGTILDGTDYVNCRSDRQANDSLVAKIRPDFVTFNGDFVYSGTTSYWSDWFTDWQFTLGTDGHLVPIIPVMGNHEASADVYNMFDVPISNDYFSLGMGGNLLRVYSLNTELSGCDATQQTWLTNDLQLYTGTTNEPYWKFVQYHIPFVPHAYYSANTTISNCWAPLFQQYNVKLACEAHAHIIKVTWPIVQSSATGSDHGFIRDDNNGTVYLGEGAWGAPLRTLYTYYNANQAYNWTRNQIKVAGFQLVCVTKQKIEIRTVEAIGAHNVGQVQMSDPPCTLPANLQLWNPSNGSVVILNYNGSLSSVPLNNLNVKQKLFAYPVPANDLVTISFTKLTNDAQIEIYNSLGAKIKTIPITSGAESEEINFTNFPEGTYFVFIISKTGTQTCKIIHIH